MKILVTGGSGFLGLHVRTFFAADDFSRRSGFDLLDERSLEMVADYDVVIHLAAHLDKSPEAAEQCFAVNAEATGNLVRHMRPESTLIFASTKDVYGPHSDTFQEVPETCSTNFYGHSPLEWSKLIGERYVDYYARTRGVRACIFRLSTIYARESDGNESSFVTHYVESVKRGWPIHLPLGGNIVRDILHVDDLSRACEAFIHSRLPYGLYNLGGGRDNALTLRSLAETVGRFIDLEPVLESDNHRHPVPINYVSDLTKIREELFWQPTIGVEEGLRSLL